MDIKERMAIIQRFDNVLKEINELRDGLRNERMKNKLVIRVSIVELIGVGVIMKNRRNRKYSVLRNEWLNNI